MARRLRSAVWLVSVAVVAIGTMWYAASCAWLTQVKAWLRGRSAGEGTVESLLKTVANFPLHAWIQ